MIRPGLGTGSAELRPIGLLRIESRSDSIGQRAKAWSLARGLFGFPAHSSVAAGSSCTSPACARLELSEDPPSDVI